MSPQKRKFTAKHAIIIFIATFLVTAEILLFINVKMRLPLLILRSSIPAILLTLIIVFFRRHIFRLYLTTFSKEFRYNHNKGKKQG